MTHPMKPFQQLISTGTIAVLLFAGPCLAGGKGTKDVTSFKIYYKAHVQEKTVFGEDSEVEKMVDSGYSLASLATKIRKTYGESVSVVRDHTLENFSKLVLEPHQQQFLAKSLSNEVPMTIRTKLDFRKFENGSDLGKLFRACYDKIDFTCDKKKKVCLYNSTYNRAKCQQKGHAFEDLLQKAHEAQATVIVNGNLADGLLQKTPANWFMYLSLRGLDENEQENDVATRRDRALVQIKELLPKTGMIADVGERPGLPIYSGYELVQE